MFWVVHGVRNKKCYVFLCMGSRIYPSDESGWTSSCFFNGCVTVLERRRSSHHFDVAPHHPPWKRVCARNREKVEKGGDSGRLWKSALHPSINTNKSLPLPMTTNDSVKWLILVLLLRVGWIHHRTRLTNWIPRGIVIVQDRVMKRMMIIHAHYHHPQQQHTPR